jgi:hypothetical protein
MAKMGPKCKQGSFLPYSGMLTTAAPPPARKLIYSTVKIILYVSTFYLFYFVFLVLSEKINTLLYCTLLCSTPWNWRILEMHQVISIALWYILKSLKVIGTVFVRNSTVLKNKRIAPMGLMVYLQNKKKRVGSLHTTSVKLFAVWFINWLIIAKYERLWHLWCCCKWVHLGLVPKVN